METRLEMSIYRWLHRVNASLLLQPSHSLYRYLRYVINGIYLSSLALTSDLDQVKISTNYNR